MAGDIVEMIPVNFAMAMGWFGPKRPKNGKPVVLTFPERIIVLGTMSIHREARELLDKAYYSYMKEE